MAEETLLEKKLQQLGLESSPEEFKDSLPAPVKRRVEALEQLQEKHEEIEEQFRKERAELEAKYEKLYAPLYVERSEIVSGTKAVGDAEAEDKGIPEFWETVLLKSDVTAELIKDKDLDVLSYLSDIQSESILEEGGLPRGFKLTFIFRENPYFTNSVLTKTYFMLPEDDGVLEKAEGTKIEWKAGKDVTIKIMKKKPKKGGKPDAKPQIKTEKVDSFFNFFSPPDVPGEDEDVDEEEMEELQALIEADYEVGATIREKLIPNAVRWYTGEAIEDELDYGFGEDDDEDEEGDMDDDEEGEDDEDDEDEDDAAPKGKAKGGKGGKGAQPPECKQQ